MPVETIKSEENGLFPNFFLFSEGKSRLFDGKYDSSLHCYDHWTEAPPCFVPRLTFENPVSSKEQSA